MLKAPNQKAVRKADDRVVSWKAAARATTGLLVAMSFVGCVSQQKYNLLRSQAENLTKALEATTDDRDRLEDRNADLESQLASVSLAARDQKQNLDAELTAKSVGSVQGVLRHRPNTDGRAGHSLV